MFKYEVTVTATFATKTAIEPKTLKAERKELAGQFASNAVGDAGLDGMQVGCGKATVTIE